jgi:hypothetical protein
MISAAALMLAGALVAPASAETTVSVAPRVWYLIDNIGFGGLQVVPSSIPGVPEQFLETAIPFHIPMVGGSVTIVPGGLPDTVFTVSALTGKGKARGNTLSGHATANNLAFARQDFRSRNARVDLEASMQRRVNDNFGWLIGARYE